MLRNYLALVYYPFLLVALILLASCGGPNTITGGSSSPTPVVPSKSLYVVLDSNIYKFRVDNGTPLWSASPSGNALASGFAPALVVVNGKNLYVGGDKLYAFDSSTGHIMWNAAVGGLTEALAADNNRIYIIWDHTVYAFHAQDGSLAWRQTVTAGILGNIRKLIVSQGILYAGITDSVFAFDAASGHQRWSFSLGNLGDTGDTLQDILLSNTTLQVQGAHTLTTLKLQNGSQLWQKVTGTMAWQVVGDTVYTVFNDSSSDPTVPSIQGLRAIQISTGNQLWQQTFQENFNEPLTMTSQALYRITGPSSGDVEARSLTNGNVLWTVPSGNTFNKLLADDKEVYATTSGGDIFALQQTDGKQLWQHQQQNILATLLDGNTFYAVVGDTFLALDRSTGSQRWHQSIANAQSDTRSIYSF